MRGPRPKKKGQISTFEAALTDVLHAQQKNSKHAKTHQRADVFNTDHKDVAVFLDFSHTLTLRNLPFHRIQSGTASMIRQSGNILDIAQAICTRSNRVLGFVHQYRVHLLMMGILSDGQLVQSWPYRGCTTFRLQWPVHSCQAPFCI